MIAAAAPAAVGRAEPPPSRGGARTVPAPAPADAGPSSRRRPPPPPAPEGACRRSAGAASAAASEAREAARQRPGGGAKENDGAGAGAGGGKKRRRAAAPAPGKGESGRRPPRRGGGGGAGAGGFAAEYACRLLDHVTCGAHSLVKRAVLRCLLRAGGPGPRPPPFLTPLPAAAYWPYSSSPLAAFDVEACVDRLAAAGGKPHGPVGAAAAARAEEKEKENEEEEEEVVVEEEEEEDEQEELRRLAAEPVDEREFLALGWGRTGAGPRPSSSTRAAADKQVPLWVVDTLPLLAEAATLFRDGGRSLAHDPAAMDRAIQVNLVGLAELVELAKAGERPAITREDREVDQLRSALGKGLIFSLSLFRFGRAPGRLQTS
ncbi:MAG: hypothetical protein BJ554DRAFT_2208 [Olpidium bornovanus]|uniref:Uncharacterized protein n=1 Tax=Olpidium bornovanus TaxID=278681 RepID=A0A8H7ZR52_9FUNG|nr:MAG: hypothetical protein BJ554DRAFT_2208 [Olpidium bornovanus]